jgi:hypothetical protein
MTKNNFFGPFKVTEERSRIRSWNRIHVSQRYGSEDPDPHQNVTNPQHCSNLFSKNLVNLVFKICRDNSALEKAFQQALDNKNRLLDYDITCEKRTKVIDDEADYYSVDSNKWLTPEQRAALERKGEELHAGRHQSRLNRRVNLDFAGRRVVEAADEISYDMNQVKYSQSTFSWFPVVKASKRTLALLKYDIRVRFVEVWLKAMLKKVLNVPVLWVFRFSVRFLQTPQKSIIVKKDSTALKKICDNSCFITLGELTGRTTQESGFVYTNSSVPDP